MKLKRTRLRPTLSGGFFVWQWNPPGRKARGWPVPPPFDRWLVAGWNRVMCRVQGHDDILWHVAQSGWSSEHAACGHCCTLLTACTGFAGGRRHTTTKENTTA